MPDRSSRPRSTGSSVEPSMTMTSLELSIPSIIGVSERMVTAPSPAAAGPFPSGTPSRADGARGAGGTAADGGVGNGRMVDGGVRPRDPVTGTIGPSDPSGGDMPSVQARGTSWPRPWSQR